jgi:histidyl-tRNA synthetase
MNDKKIKLETTAYKGVRDFFPEDMFVQNYIFSVMKKVVEKFGYQEYSASVLEPANLYRAKSGEEIVNEQTYTFTDRGDREVTLRPEMTPTLARMIAARRRELPTPIRWYSIPNLFRYENPQRGRLREHWQLNVDLFGVKSVDADVEIISIVSEILRTFGLKDQDFEIRVNSRKIVNFILNEMFSLSEADAVTVSKLIDRKNKMSNTEFENKIKEIMPEMNNAFLTLLNSKNFTEFSREIPEGIVIQESLKEISDLLGNLENLGITNVVFDQTIMRGFDYYTGIVFEVYDKSPDNRRAVFGGGRYDDLLSIFGSEKVPAVGFGAGDVIIRDLLETYNLMPKYKNPTELYICIANASAKGFAQDLAQTLREQGLNVAIDYTNKKVGDQIKYADKMKIPFITCLGDDEIATGQMKIKKLESGDEVILPEEKITNYIKTN